MKIPKVLFIDWNGTLSNSKFWGHLEKSNATLFKKIENYLFRDKSHVFGPWMKGELTSEDICKMISIDLNLSYKKIFSNFVRSCEQMELVEPNLLDVISNLRKKNIKIYVATDNMDSFNRWTVPSLKLNSHFDGVLNSYNLKNRKHDFDDNSYSLFFGDFLKSIGAKASESMLIDDGEDKGGRLAKYGISYIQIDNSMPLLKVLKDIEEKVFN